HYQGNRDPHLRFALLTDFADAPEEEMPEDEDLLRYAIRGIRDLNRRYDPEGRGLFYLFHRRRQWNPSEGSWMGWERKRGKLVEFNHLLRGDEHTSYTTQLGEVEALLGAEIRFVITLDADTILPRGAAHRLVATLAHPLNRAEFVRGSAQVLSGYTILQPRTEIKPADVGRSLFCQAFAGDVGLDLYTRAVSDVYQDLFGEGIYVGKGIYDVDAFERSLRDRVPENSLLSHDLFEGIHGRAALVTDIVLYESYPPEYLAYAQRLHRWVRGDWQLLPWLLPGVPKEGGGTCPNRLSVIDRWKIFDNLRRSLHAPALLAFLVLGWLWLPGSPLVWTLIALFVSGLPLFAGAVTALARGLQPSGRTPLPSLRAEALRWLFSLVFLPYEALLMVDAIGATLVRLLISRKRLLQWTTSAHTLRI
ncbi:MAG: GH36-type glycosyl hydrolase domain-containing protein, partial [Anaerolineae bacterium]